MKKVFFLLWALGMTMIIPACARYQALVTPTTPAPNTNTCIVALPSDGQR